MTDRAAQTLTNLEDLVACPSCDTLHRLSAVAEGSKASCVRCHRLLLNPRPNAMTKIVMLSVTATILMVTAISFPFLKLEAKGLTQQSSVVDAVLAFSNGLFLPLAVAVAALIVVLPLVRLFSILYVVAPMAFGDTPAPGAAIAFRVAARLKPWAMAEVFIIGTAVAMVKIAGLATLTLGPAFFAFAALVIVTIFQDIIMSPLIVWQTLERRTTR